VKIVQISDLHLGGELYGIDPLKRLRLALESIKKYHFDASLLVISGDLAHNGDKEAYLDLKKELIEFYMPVYLVAGNHDNKELLKQVFFKGCYSEFLHFTKEIEGYKFIFLDTTIEGKHSGTLCMKRLDWLKEQLDESLDRDVYIFMHHFPLNSDIYAMDRVYGFENSGAFLSLLQRYSSVKHLFCGHMHRNIFARYSSFSLSSTKSLVHQIAYKAHSKENLLTVKENPSYVVAFLEPNQLLIQNCEFLTQEESFLEE